MNSKMSSFPLAFSRTPVDVPREHDQKALGADQIWWSMLGPTSSLSNGTFQKLSTAYTTCFIIVSTLERCPFFGIGYSQHDMFFVLKYDDSATGFGNWS